MASSVLISIPIPISASPKTLNDTASLDTASLPELAREGNREALGRLYSQFAPRLLRVIWRIVGNREDAEDVLHDLFVGLPKALGRYEDRGRLDAWLAGCAARAALAHLRSRGRRREESLSSDQQFIAASRPDLGPELLELEARIAALPTGLRSVLVLRKIEGLSHAEIAAALGVSVGNSRIRLARALEQLNASR